MKEIVIKIILFAICAALIISVVIPIAGEIKNTGQKSFNSVKALSNNIVEE